MTQTTKRRSGGRRADFETWLKQNCKEKDYTWSWPYQRYLYEHLSRVTKGECQRLMIFMPPRHGKSETVTIRYTAWRLLRDPKLSVILSSYSQRLADRFSRRIKRMVAAQRMQTGALHPQDSSVGAGAEPAAANTLPGNPVNSASEWETAEGGGVRSVGVGGGIAGFGARLIVIDDPVRNRADAESEHQRDKTWDWFNDDIYTRLEPDAAIILIQTRWHEDDLAGRLLREQEDGGEQWEVIRLPALAEGLEGIENGERMAAIASGELITDSEEGSEILNSEFSILNSNLPDPLGRKPGEALCPKRFSEKSLARIRQKIGTYSFSALYQQDPVPAQAGRFRREWFRNIVDSPPSGLRWIRGYDLAISMSTSADYTASFRCAYDDKGNLYIADGFRSRMEYPEQRRFIIDRMQNEPGTEHAIESAMHGKAVVQDLRREPTLRRYPLREVSVTTDKLTRALAWLNLAEAGKVFLVRGPWIADFLDEVCRFPSGRYDDQVDAVSLAVTRSSEAKRKTLHFF